MFHVLLVDDQPSVLTLLSAICEQADIPHSTASDAYDALARLQQQATSVLVTDLRMPGLNGIELFRLAQRQFPQLRGIVFSGYVTYEVLLQILEAGFDDCLHKPLRDIDALVASIGQSQDRFEHWRRRVVQLRGIPVAHNPTA